MEPILKWAGGKRQLLKKLLEHISKEELNGHTYYEPFIGGGALFLHLAPRNAVIGDVNSELIGLYKVIRENPDGLISVLKEYREGYPENYETIRSMDRKKGFSAVSELERAARFIYLNKTCYNGLYRVNSQGFFNVPAGKYKNPDIVNEHRIKKLSDYLRKNSVEILNCDFEKCTKRAKRGDFIYFDPPYDYEETGFTTYSADGFTRNDLSRLKSVCDDLIRRGCVVLLSNNDTQFVNELFSEPYYEVFHIEANRFINCDGSKRTKAKEVIIYGKQK